MKYTIVEGFHRRSPKSGKKRKDYKPIHELGECKSIDQARELAKIWLGLQEQGGYLGNLVTYERSITPGKFRRVRLGILDEDGTFYRWFKPEERGCFGFIKR